MLLTCLLISQLCRFWTSKCRLFFSFDLYKNESMPCLRGDWDFLLFRFWFSLPMGLMCSNVGKSGVSSHKKISSMSSQNYCNQLLSLKFDYAPCWIRTSGPLLRRQLLYPAELREPEQIFKIKTTNRALISKPTI